MNKSPDQTTPTSSPRNTSPSTLPWPTEVKTSPEPLGKRPRLLPLRDLLPPLTLEEYERLKASIADFGYVGEPTVVDQDNNTVDGFHRQRACEELGIDCPREVRFFHTVEERYELALRLNCRRRQLRQKQKQALIEVYLRCDPRINDKHLADIIGVSPNTVASVRDKLITTSQIEKFARLRGRDGKERPTTYKKIIANTAKEAEAATKAIADLPDNCAGRTIDVITARRRARRNRHHGDRDPNPAPPLAGDDIQLHHCRFQDLAAVADIEPSSVNLICTDIPYQPEFLPQLSELAVVASELLTPEGLFLTYCGKLYLPEVFLRLGERLTYRWMISSIWSGEGSSMRSLDLVSRWKPILIFSRGKWEKRPRWYDVLKTDGKEKQWHPGSNLSQR